MNSVLNGSNSSPTGTPKVLHRQKTNVGELFELLRPL